MVKRVTIRNVAEDAGVSVSAVSKVLRNAYGVSDGLRQSVQTSIDRLGYRPSVAARGMRGRTYTVGILLVTFNNPFLGKVIAGISARLEEAGYKTIIAVGQARTQLETSLIESMIDFKIDGLVLVAPRLGSETLTRFARQIPIVTIAHHEPDAGAFDTVNSDDRAGGALAVSSLIARGYRDIAMVSLPLRAGLSIDVAAQRERGYADAMNAAGLALRPIIRIPEGGQQETDEMNRLLSAKDRPRAVFCWSDLHAVPLVNLASLQGLNVPRDLAVIGYDNSPVGGLPLINLTSIRQQAREIGESAADCILSRLCGRAEPEHILHAPSMMERGSA